MRKFKVEECSQALLPHSCAWGVHDDLSLTQGLRLVPGKAGVSHHYPVWLPQTLGWLYTLVPFGMGVSKAEAKSQRAIITHYNNNNNT